jgi:hypothetical protein
MALAESAEHNVNWIELALDRVHWHIFKDLDQKVRSPKHPRTPDVLNNCEIIRQVVRHKPIPVTGRGGP